MRSYLPAVVDASQAAEFPVTGTPAGTVAVRAAGLQVQGRTVIVGDAVPAAGELAVFCRPVVTAPAVIRRNGTVLADAWLPDLVRLGGAELTAAWVSDRGSGQPFSGLQGQAEGCPARCRSQRSASR